MTRNQNLAALGLLIAVAAATMIWFQLRPDAVPAAPTSPTAPATESAALAFGDSPAKPRVRRMEDPSGRGELLRQIRAVHAKRGTPGAPGSSSETPAPPLALPEPPTMDKDYIRASVRELTPLLIECYEHALLRVPNLLGTLVVEFTIEGEPGVGAVVGESSIDPVASTLTDREFGECIQETMFTIELEPPVGGGVVKVRYPFEFRVAGD